MKIIGFAGLARCGKTTTCDLMEKWGKDNGYKVVRMSFAGPLKDALKRAGITKEKNPSLYREVAQRWGMTRRDPEYRPGVTGPDYWVMKTLFKLIDLADDEHQRYIRADRAGKPTVWKETLVLFDDVRYENECKMIKSLNGTLVFVSAWDRLFRRGNKEEWEEGSWRWHESEKMAVEFEVGVSEDTWFDYVLVNEKTDKNLRDSIPHYASLWVDNSDIDSLVTTKEH